MKVEKTERSCEQYRVVIKENENSWASLIFEFVEAPVPEVVEWKEVE